VFRPRFTDFHGIYLPQAEVDFAIPFLNEDIPLYVDPFLLWKSPSFQDQSLHAAILQGFNSLGALALNGNYTQAIAHLTVASECDEVGLGQSATRRGKRIGAGQAKSILELFERIPAYQTRGFRHIEEIQLFIDGISKDRISDLTCNFIKSFLIDYTIDQCEILGIPTQDCTVKHVYDLTRATFADVIETKLPCNPVDGRPLLLVPKRWLRFSPWLDFENYFMDYCPRDKIFKPGEAAVRARVLNYNRDNYGVVEAYVAVRERAAHECKNDPLFAQVAVVSARRLLKRIEKLPTGKHENADREYEELVGQLLASLLYPHLDFAEQQSRTESGVLIRDVVFYNNRSHEFLRELFDDYGSRQLVMELKNTATIERDHVNQLNRYMTDSLGRFGVLVTRTELEKARYQSTIDLWSGQRRAVVALTDVDIAQMVELYDSKQRLPLDVLKKKYVQFRRSCPA